MEILALRLCGDVELTSVSGAVVEPVLGAKALALLAFLALEPGIHQREELTTLLWGDSPEEKAKASLRQALTHLRDALHDALRIDRTTVELVGPLVCDVTEFVRLAPIDANAALAIDVPACLATLRSRCGRSFEEWTVEKRAELTGHYATLLGASARDALARRAWHDAITLAQRWQKLDPFVDAPTATLVEAQYLAGEGDAALASYARHLARLTDEAMRPPGRALAALAARIKQDASARMSTRKATERWYEQTTSFMASLIGRSSEWTVMTRAWEHVTVAGSHVLLIDGEPGVGKSRLIEDFLRWVTAKEGVVLRGRGYDGRAAPPFGAVIEALHTSLDAPGLAGADPEWLAEVSRLLPELRQRFPGLPVASGGTSAADGWRLFEGIAQLLLVVAEESPLVISIDDLLWCDADSCSLLHFLVRRLAEARVLWCVTLTVGEVERDAPAAGLARALRVTRFTSHITLRALSENDVWQLIRELGRVASPIDGRRLAARVHEVTAGNPFYVIELLKTLFAEELLTVDAATGAWIVPASVLSNPETHHLAPTVHEAIASRMACLPDDLSAVLISLAASGRGCRADVLSHLHGISRLHAATLGDRLVDRHLAEDIDGTYRCAHPMIAAVVKDRLTTSRRREVNRALATALEVLLPSRGDGAIEVGEIARFAEQAGDRPMTHRYALLASETALQQCAYDEALSWLDVASAAADTSGESDAVNSVKARLLSQAGWNEPPAARAPVSLTLRHVERRDIDLPTSV